MARKPTIVARNAMIIYYSFVDGGCLGLGFVDGEDECADESDECEYVLHSFFLC